MRKLMKNLKGTKTEQNLMTAYAEESQGSIKYGYYSSKEKKKDMYKSVISFLKHQETKKNMQNLVRTATWR